MNLGSIISLKQKVIYFLLFLICILGVYIRFLAIKYSIVDVPIRADALDYYSYVVNMREWGVYSNEYLAQQQPSSDAYRSPGYPWFAYLFYSVEQDIFLKKVLLAQTLFQIITFAFLIAILNRFLGGIVALICSVFFWTFPHFVNINIYFLSESIFTSLLAGAIGIAIWSSYTEKYKNLLYFVFSLLIGLAILVRPTLQYLPILLFFILVFYDRKISKQALLILIVGLLPMLLWGARNILSVGQWSDPTLMINGLYHGSFPWFMYNDNPASLGIPYRFDPQAQEVYQGVGKTLEIIFSRVYAEPGQYVHWYLMGKQFYLWQWNIIAGQGDIFIYPTIASPYYGDKIAIITHSLHKMIHLSWLIVAFVGLMIIMKKIFQREFLSYGIIVIASIFLYAILIHIIVAPFPRYGIPFKIPVMILFAIVVSEILKWIKRKFA